MRKTVLVPIADGSEEIEAVCVIDVLRRAGADVTVASVDGLQVTASRGVKIVADRLIADCAAAHFDLIAVPGGMPGAERLRDNPILTQLLMDQQQKGGLIAAICAAPVVVLAHHGLLKGRRATAHPAFGQHLAGPGVAASRVVTDNNLITSQGPGTALEFALELVRRLFGKNRAGQVAGPMMVSVPQA
jgi:4-methyl-5(b-hydroxyethyl)-thiazole monophosphate biosynthesis